jgi:DNA mismatch endonuclease Vsr
MGLVIVTAFKTDDCRALRTYPSRVAAKVILVHGCFWHQHKCHLGRKIPASNTEYWHPKLAGNVARDEYIRAELVCISVGMCL